MRTIRVAAGLFVLSILVGALAFAAADEDACDLKTLKTLKVCVVCDDVVEKGDTHCDEKVDKVEFCVKTYYECEECGETSFKPGKCCDAKMEKQEDLARTIWACPECGMGGEKGDKCSDCDKALVKTCESSGTFPHVAEKKKARKDD
jgi:hypothetical protein